ncbi:hypothetical protein [Yoonia sp.]
MTNTIAIWLAVLIIVLLGIDYVLYDWASTIFLLRKFLDLIGWVAFWR